MPFDKFSLFRRLVLAVQNRFNNFDPSIMSGLYDENSLVTDPPIFIIGSPRAGSTLLFQILCSQFRLSYISNIMAIIPSWMVRLTKYMPALASGYTGQIKESRYGYIPGLMSPNESGKILAKWLDVGQDPDHDLYVRRTFAAITALTGSPIVLKNQNRLTVNIDRLESIFTNACYIAIERDPLYTAQSLLIARREVLQDERSWFSAQPPGYEKVLDRDPYFQVIWQVLALKKIVAEKRKLIPQARFFTLDYEEFCAGPASHLRRLQDQYHLQWQPDADPDAIHLTASKKRKLSSQDWENLERGYSDVLDSALI
jgi:hypothetical protein